MGDAHSCSILMLVALYSLKGSIMQKDHANAIKGLSIAALVISALSVIVWIFAISSLGLVSQVGSYAMDDYYDYGSPYGHHYDYYDFDDYYYDGFYYDGSASDRAIFTAIMNLISGFAWVALFTSIVTIVAAIIALKFYRTPTKFGLVFGWSIAGAILSVLSCFITLVLFIIIAVFVHKDKQLYAAGAYPADPGADLGSPYVQPAVPVAPQPLTPAPAPPAQMIPSAAPAAPTPEPPAATPSAAPVEALAEAPLPSPAPTASPVEAPVVGATPQPGPSAVPMTGASTPTAASPFTPVEANASTAPAVEMETIDIIEDIDEVPTLSMSEEIPAAPTPEDAASAVEADSETVAETTQPFPASAGTEETAAPSTPPMNE